MSAYTLNSVPLADYNIIPGKHPGSNLAVRGAWDMPARLGKALHDWTDLKGVQPYIAADEIRYAGRDIDFIGYIHASSKQEALKKAYGLFDALDALNGLATLSSDKYGSWDVFVRGDIKVDYIASGYCSLNIPFREPVVDLTGTVPANSGTFDGNGIDGVAFESIGILPTKAVGTFNRPSPKPGEATAYIHEPYCIVPVGPRDLVLHAFIERPDFASFQTVVTGLYALLGRPGLRTLVRQGDAIRDVFVKDGFRIDQVNVLPGKVYGFIEIRFTEVRSFIYEGSGDITAPPEVVAADTNEHGTAVILRFDKPIIEEVGDTSAITVSETRTDSVAVTHSIIATEVSGETNTVTIRTKLPVYKSSTVRISYNGTTGGLTSVFGVKAGTFSNLAVTNEVSEQLYPFTDWTDIDDMTISSNNLTSAGEEGRARGGNVLPLGDSGVMRVSFDSASDSIYLGLDTVYEWGNLSTIKYLLRKDDGRPTWRLSSGSMQQSAVSLGMESAMMQFRVTPTLIYVEYSTNNGETWNTLDSYPITAADLHLKILGSGKLLNVSHRGFDAVVPVPTPDAPTNMVIDNVNKTVTWDNSAGYPTADHEYTTNYSSSAKSWHPVTAKPIDSSQMHIAAGDFAVRVKAATGRSPSPALVSETDIEGEYPDDRIFIMRATGGIVYTTNSFISAWNHLKTITFTEDMVLQFNTSDTFDISSLLGEIWRIADIKNNNGQFNLTIRSAPGERAVIDGGGLYASVIRSVTDNLTMERMRVVNSSLTNSGGCIIRADYTADNSFLDMEMYRGYCGMRATEGVVNLKLDTIKIGEVPNGTFRLGNGSSPYPDTTNLIVRNILIDDSTLENGSMIPGTSLIFKPFVLLKHAQGMIFENVRSVSGKLYDLGNLETSVGVTVRNIVARSLWAISCTDMVFENCYLPSDNYFSNPNGMSFYHCQMWFNMVNGKNLRNIRGCVFPIGFSMGLNSLSDMPLEESDNVFGNTSGNYMNFYTASTGYAVQASNLASWLANGFGVNSVYTNNSAIKMNSDGTLKAASSGKELITAVINGVSNDAREYSRVYPTDAGPFSGRDAAGNKVADQPDLIIDVFQRTISASIDPLFSIEYSVDGGSWQAYTVPVYVGNSAVAAGYYRFRGVGSSGVVPGVTVDNMYVPEFNPNEMPIDNWPGISGFNVSGPNSNSLVPSGSSSTPRARSGYKIASGDTGYVKALAAAILGLRTTDALPTNANNFNYYMYRNSANGNVYGTGFNNIVPGAPLDTLVRIRVEITSVYYEYSIDNGETWNIALTEARVAGDLFIQVFKGYSSRDAIYDIIGLGVTEV